VTQAVDLVQRLNQAMRGEEEQELRQADPQLVTVLMTGWILDEADARREAVDFYLQKPFIIDEVEEIVARALVRRRARADGGQATR
jgi:DNA-binding NtrC family response regulator